MFRDRQRLMKKYQKQYGQRQRFEPRGPGGGGGGGVRVDLLCFCLFFFQKFDDELKATPFFLATAETPTTFGTD